MSRRADAGLWLGLFLVLVGAAAFAAQFVPVPTAFDLGQYGWPVFVFVPGVTLLVVGLTVRGVSGLCVPGTMVTVLALVLAVQNAFDLWATWAYAWALVAPAGAGLGVLLQGVASGSPATRRAGFRTLSTGIALFLVFGAFFEGVLHISGRTFGIAGQLLLPVLLIVLGLWLLLRRLLEPGGRPA